MEFNVTLERKPAIVDDSERITQELERKAELDIARFNGKIPTIEEILYHTDEESMLDLKDLVNDATN